MFKFANHQNKDCAHKSANAQVEDTCYCPIKVHIVYNNGYGATCVSPAPPIAAVNMFFQLVTTDLL